MDKKISELFDYGEGILPEERDMFDAAQIRAMTLERIHAQKTKPARRIRHTGRTLLFAAVITSLLTVTAVAAGLSIHSRRQEEVRQELAIEENHVQGYQEYSVPEETRPGVTLLSSINNGESQKVYVNVSPVTPEEYALCLDVAEEPRYNFFYRTPDMDGYGMCGLPGPEREAYYDEESRTLTLALGILNDGFDAEGKAEVHLYMYDWNTVAGSLAESAFYRDFGTVTVTRTEARVKTVMFDTPVAFTNPETGGTGSVLGVEMLDMGFRWLIRYEDAAWIFSFPELEGEEQRAYLELTQSWLNAGDGIESTTVLHYADGREHGDMLAIRADYDPDADIVRDICAWDYVTIDLDNVVSISIGGETFPVE